MSDTPVLPPIPPVEISDPNRRVTREWWRWFQRSFLVAQEQQTLIAGQGAAIDELQIIVSSAGPPGVPADDVAGLSWPADIPAPAVDVDAIAVSAWVMDVPPPTVDPDQIAMQAMMLRII